MKKGLLFLLFFVVIISLFISWRIIVSPQYSLKQLKKTIVNNDTVTFDKYVDLDRAVEAAIDQIWQYNSPVVDSSKNLWFDIRNEIGNALLSVVKPNLKEIIKREIYSYISQGEWEGAISQGGNRLISVFVKKVKEIVNPDDWEFQSVNYVKIKNDVASLGLTYYNRTKQSNFIVEVEMRKMSRYWQITEITNINQLLNIFLNIANSLKNIQYNMC